MSGEVNIQELNGEIDRILKEGNYTFSTDLSSHVHNYQTISVPEVDAQGFLRFFESMLAKMLKKDPDGSFEHQIAHIYYQWDNLTEESRNFIICITIIQNQEDHGVPLPDDLDIHTLKLLTFNVLECLVESLLENYGKLSTTFSASSELSTNLQNITENNIVPYPDTTSDLMIEENIRKNYSVNILEAYHASELLLNLDENAILE